MSSFTWRDDEYESVTCVRVSDSGEFVRLLTSYLLEGCHFLTEDECRSGVPAETGAVINNTLLGSVSEFAVYVCSCEELTVSFPFIGCFRRPSPFAKGNFPLVDVRLFRVGTTPTDDLYQLLEIKTTRNNPSYFRETISDFRGLYAKSRLYDSAEHTKADLVNAGMDHLVPRLNDCLGTCPEDSDKIEIVPTGVSCDSCDEDSSVVVLQDVVRRLQADKWKQVSAFYFAIPNLEETYLSFAVGEGDDD